MPSASATGTDALTSAASHLYSSFKFLGEKHPVALVRQQRKLIHGCRGRVRNKRCSIGLAGPADLRDVLHKIPDEPILYITNFRAAHRMAPTDVPGDLRVNFRSIHQRVDHVVIVLYVNVACLERCVSGRKVHRDCVF